MGGAIAKGNAETVALEGRDLIRGWIEIDSQRILGFNANTVVLVGWFFRRSHNVAIVLEKRDERKRSRERTAHL